MWGKSRNGKSPYEVVENSNDCMITIVEDTVTPRGASIYLNNCGAEELQYGEWFVIEMKLETDWCILLYVKQPENIDYEYFEKQNESIEQYQKMLSAFNSESKMKTMGITAITD